MTCKAVAASELEKVAAEVGVKLSVGTAQVSRKWGVIVRFTLRPLGEKFRRVDQLHHERPRRVNAVCYHGHCAFFDLLFERFPTAVVESWQVKYAGAEDYADKRDAADVWEGNDYYGRVRYSTQCRCADERLKARLEGKG
jgi:hypothetical protein